MGFWAEAKAAFWQSYYAAKARRTAKEREMYKASVDALAAMMRMDAAIQSQETDRAVQEALRDLAERMALEEAPTNGKVH